MKKIKKIGKRKTRRTRLLERKETNDMIRKLKYKADKQKIKK